MEVGHAVPAWGLMLGMCAQYVSEAVAAIAETSVKTKDVGAVVQVRSAFAVCGW